MIHELSIELAPSTLQHVGCPKSDSSTTRSRRVWFPQTADQHHQEGGIRNQAETCDHRLLSSRLTISDKHTSELQSLMRTSYAGFSLQNKQHVNVQRIIHT